MGLSDPTIAEILDRPWPAPVGPRDVLNAAEYLGVRLHDGRVPRIHVARVSLLVEDHAWCVATGQRA